MQSPDASGMKAVWSVPLDKACFHGSQPSKSLSEQSEGASYDALRFRRPSEPECTSDNDWMLRLCRTVFFSPCEEHKNKRKNECTFFCLDAPNTPPLCAFCMPNYANLRTLQIRRYVYRDVVKQVDVLKYMDVSGIQTYIINQAKVVFISAKDKSVAPYSRSDSTCSCQTCGRSLREGFLYCSLSCKVERSENSNSLSITPSVPSACDGSTHSNPLPSPPGPACSLKGESDVLFHPILGGKVKSVPSTYAMHALKSRNAPPPLPRLKDRRVSDASDTIIFARNNNSRRKQSTPCRSVN